MRVSSVLTCLNERKRQQASTILCKGIITGLYPALQVSAPQKRDSLACPRPVAFAVSEALEEMEGKVEPGMEVVVVMG